MKIYIVGAVSSGKSTLAKKLSKELKIPYKSLDDV
ncbi:DNA topology modulation protein FlaR, partial [Clostridium saudiense]|nr:DNA topology modulation protein FlaR [Clostridium saudiense]